MQLSSKCISEWTFITGVVLFLISGVCVASGAAPSTAPEPQVPYRVECESGIQKCKVDKSTYIGWRTYHAVCHVCHAQNAVGSTFAPSLLTRLEGMDKARFDDVVGNGFTGQVGVMPGWKDDPNVMPRLDDLWHYLKARSDGALGVGKPGRLP